MHKLIEYTPRTSALSPEQWSKAWGGFQHRLLLSLLNLQSEVSWLSGFCHMESNSPAMSYLTGRTVANLG